MKKVSICSQELALQVSSDRLMLAAMYSRFGANSTNPIAAKAIAELEVEIAWNLRTLETHGYDIFGRKEVKR